MLTLRILNVLDLTRSFDETHLPAIDLKDTMLFSILGVICGIVAGMFIHGNLLF